MDATKTYHRIADRETPETEKRWMSWSVLVQLGRKHSFAGVDPAVKAKRRAKGKRQRAARKVNR